MYVVRRCTIALITAAITFAGVAGAARADDLGVLTAITKQGNSLAASPELQKLEHFRVTTRAQARKAVPALRTVSSKLRHAANVVSRTDGSTPAGKAGRVNWVAGVRGLAHGYAQLIIACQDLERGSVGSSNTETFKALATIRASEKRLTTAKKELGKAVKGL